MICHVIMSFCGDLWIPLKITDISDKPLTIKEKKEKLGFGVYLGTSQPEQTKQVKKHNDAKPTDLKQQLQQVGLTDTDIEKYASGKEQLVELLEVKLYLLLTYLRLW